MLVDDNTFFVSPQSVPFKTFFLQLLLLVRQCACMLSLSPSTSSFIFFTHASFTFFTNTSYSFLNHFFIFFHSRFTLSSLISPSLSSSTFFTGSPGPTPPPIAPEILAQLPEYLKEAPLCATRPSNRSFCVMPHEYPRSVHHYYFFRLSYLHHASF